MAATIQQDNGATGWTDTPTGPVIAKGAVGAAPDTGGNKVAMRGGMQKNRIAA